MHKYTVLLFLFLLPTSLLLRAQETVHPITTVERDDDFYKTQMGLWKKVTEREPHNAAAWQNYYHAARYYQFPAIFRDSSYRKEVDQIVEAMGRAIPETFEYHYIYAWHQGFGDDNFDHLMKAYRLDSTRPKIIEDLFTHYHARAEWDKAAHFMRRWHSLRTMPPQLLHFCYNMLACTEENGVLFLSGDNDSYPTWMLQTAMGVRTDVAALNLYVLMDPDYARKALQLHGLKVEDSAFQWLDRSSKDLWKNMVRFVRHIAEQNPGRKVYLPVAMQQEVIDALEEDLYVVGPIFQYSPQRFDNIATLKRNWKYKLQLDYIDFTPYGDGYNYSPEGLPYTLLVYLYPAAALYLHYEASGEVQQAEEVLAFAQKISQMIGKPDHYKAFIKGLDE